MVCHLLLEDKDMGLIVNRVTFSSPFISIMFDVGKDTQVKDEHTVHEPL